MVYSNKQLNPDFSNLQLGKQKFGSKQWIALEIRSKITVFDYI